MPVERSMLELIRGTLLPLYIASICLEALRLSYEPKLDVQVWGEYSQSRKYTTESQLKGLYLICVASGLCLLHHYGPGDHLHRRSKQAIRF